MVAANEAVAAWLVDRGLPGLFRVHPEPTPERVRDLALFAHNFGFEAGFGPRLSPRGLAAFEAQFRGSPLAPAIRTVLGRALGQARYTVHPSLHFGLAAPLYLHFTSPIRRYADLAVHRVIKRYLEGDRSLEAGDASLEALAHHLNHAAYIAGRAEAERHRMLIARYMASRIGERVAGNIVGIKPFGLIAQMKGTGATGTIGLDALPDGPYRVDPLEHAVVSPTRQFRIGDPIEATIAGANEDLGRVDLALVKTDSPEV
jgi:ribonuclease R